MFVHATSLICWMHTRRSCHIPAALALFHAAPSALDKAGDSGVQTVLLVRKTPDNVCGNRLFWVEFWYLSWLCIECMIYWLIVFSFYLLWQTEAPLNPQVSQSGSIDAPPQTLSAATALWLHHSAVFFIINSKLYINSSVRFFSSLPYTGEETFLCVRGKLIMNYSWHAFQFKVELGEMCAT